MSNLKTLRLDGDEHVTDAGLSHLAALKQLKTLQLRGTPKVTDAGVAELTQALPKTHGAGLQGTGCAGQTGAA